MRLSEIARPSVFYHVTLTENVKSILQHGLIPQTGRNSEQIGDYGIFLFDSEQSMEDALGSWLGEEYEDMADELGVDIADIDCTALKISLPSEFPITPAFEDQDTSTEWVSTEPIPPLYISVFKEV